MKDTLLKWAHDLEEWRLCELSRACIELQHAVSLRRRASATEASFPPGAKHMREQADAIEVTAQAAIDAATSGRQRG